MRRDAKEIRFWLSIPFQVRRVQNGTTAGDVNTEGNLSLRVSVHIIISSSHSYINMKWCTFNHLYSRHFRTFDELKRARGIPPIEAFYSTLSKSGISEKEHRHAQEVYLIFGCKSFLSYLELYNRCDTGKTEYHKCIVVNKFINRFLPHHQALLADVFEAHRAVLYEKLQLDCCWYVSGPSFSLDAALKCSSAVIEPVRDQRLLDFSKNYVKGMYSAVDR